MVQRQCVILQGARDWAEQQAIEWQQQWQPARPIWLSDHSQPARAISQQQALNQLGKEFDFIVFDALEGINADSLAAIIGTLAGGGILLLLLPQQLADSRWWQRFYRIIQHYCRCHAEFSLLQQGEQISPLPSPAIKAAVADPFRLTDDQQQALQAIFKVVKGHRRRPLLLHSDRGRGKTTLLGVAAAHLLKQGKQTILVTAPSLATVAGLFEQAHQQLTAATVSRGRIDWQQQQIRFVAIDALLDNPEKADLLLVDEAAAIPAAMLSRLLSLYSRIVFASTLHGYEGTGRGFAVRFQQTLDQQTPGWQQFELTTPVRWSATDQLEPFSFEALLLDADAVADEQVAAAKVNDCNFEAVDRSQLANNETDLRALFGLMVLAHYRTRPTDLQLLLDQPDISIYVLRYQRQIVASVWLAAEGGLDDKLASAIHGGERRLKGQLLPQSLLAHAGISGAAAVHYQRVIRITVHPALQQRGLGSKLLNQLSARLVKNGSTEVLGTSFAADSDLIRFWAQAGFVPARLGQHHDKVSGRHAVMMLKPLADSGKNIVEQAQSRMQSQWALALGQSWQQLDPQLVIVLSQQLATPALELSPWDKNDIEAFAFKQRSFASSQIPLWLWLKRRIHQADFLLLSDQQQQLLVMVILQQRDWQEIGHRLALQGQAAIVAQLRRAVALLSR